MRKAVSIPVVVIALLVVGGGVAMAAYDHARRELIAPGVRIGGVPVGGLHADDARARVTRALRGPLSQPVVVRAGHHHFTLPARRLHQRVNVAALVDQAVAVSRRGSIFTRTLHGIEGTHVNRDLPVAVDYSHAAVRRLTRRVARTVERPARDASVSPHATGLTITHSHTGIDVNRRDLRAALEATLQHPDGSRTVQAPLHRIAPKVTLAQLREKYASYIVVDRNAFTLRFYRHLKLQKTYPIAVGMQGLETPAGLYHIQWKQTNPSWYVPNSPWAGSLAGKVIPPGPQDPIKARWMAFNGGAGIHGIDPSEYGTIGHQASHGCVRMRIPDVIELYSQTPVGTPVFVA